MQKKPYIIAFFFFLVDLLSKQLVLKMIEVNTSIKLINDFFYLTHTHNTGAAWNMLENKRILLLIVTVIVLFLINKYMNKEKLNKSEVLSYGMIIGGILGNLFDRIFFKYVIDFLDFRILGYNYPVFNLADSFIVIGIVLMIIINVRKDCNERSSCRKRKH